MASAMTMAQLDPELRKLLVREAKQPGTLEQISEPLRVFLKFQGDLAPLEALGFKPQTVRGNIATGRLPASRLPEISKHPNALKMQLSRKLHEDLDQSITEVRANTVRSVDASGTWSGLATGRGVIVGVIDSGINFKHQSFRNADGTTRILAIWDQSSSAGATPTDHAGSFGTYDYGSVYDQNEINAALRESNPVPIPHKDRSSGHGTHVTGIAAGNGRQDDRCHDPHDFNGVAPEADLVIIKISTEDEALGEDMHLADAISFINDLADAQTPPQPVVINLSQGDNLGPHDGTSLVEQLIDLEYGSLSPGKALVKSAGNEGASNRHAEGTVPSAGQLDIEFTVKSGDKKTRLLELWYPGEDPVLGENLLRCQVVTPDGSVTSPSVTPGDLENFHPQGDTEVTITSDTNDIDNGDKRIRIELDPEGGKLPSGQWKVRLSNSGALGVPVHCWIERGTGGPTFTDSSRDTTLSIPGTARHAVVVGNYIYKGDNAGERTRSSSRGPTRDGGRPVNEQKPDLSAPGTKVMSARAHDLPCCEAFWCCCRERHHHDKTGTSMAAPHVAGAIALMFELHPELEATEVIEVLRETARSDGFTGGVPNDRWGAGKLDVRAAADEALLRSILEGPSPPGPSPSPPGPSPAPPEPSPAQPRVPAMPPVPIDVDHLYRRLLDTSGGREYARLFERHYEEVLHLINTNKRVGAVWHRNGGPMLVRAVLRSLAYADEPLPEIINGVSVRDRLNPFLGILRRYGSNALVTDIARHESELRVLPGRTVNHYLSVLEHRAH